MRDSKSERTGSPGAPSASHRIGIGEFIDSFGTTRKTWALFFLLSFAMFFDGYDNMIVNFSLPSIQAEWGLNSTMAGSLSSWSLFGLVAGGLVAGPASDKWGRKHVMAVSIALFGVLNLPLYFAPDWESFAAFRVLSGIGLGACIPMVTTCFSEWMPTRNRAFFITAAMAFMVGGGVVAGVVGGMLCDSATAAAVVSGQVAYSDVASVELPFVGGLHMDGWRIGFFIGAVPVLYSALIWLFLPETPQYYASVGRLDKSIAQLARYEKVVTGSTAKADALAPGMLAVPLKQEKTGPATLFSKRYIKGTLAIWIAYFCGCMIIYSVNAWLPRLCGSLGYDYSLATINQAASVLANLLTGLVAGRIGRRRNAMLGFSVAFVVIVVTAVSFMANSPYPLLTAVMVFLGFGINYGQTGLQPLMPETYPTEIRGTGVAWCQAFGRFGGALGPIAMGLILDVALSFGLDAAVAIPLAFIVLAIPAAVSVVAIALLAEDNGARSAM